MTIEAPTHTIGLCASCGEGAARDECPKSLRPCGHHCNHSWESDVCCWCGETCGAEPRPVCVHEDGTEHPCEEGDDGLFGPCADAVHDEPTVEDVVAELTDVIARLDRAAVRLVELLPHTPGKRDTVDAVWAAWAYAEIARDSLRPVGAVPVHVRFREVGCPSCHGRGCESCGGLGVTVVKVAATP